MSKMSGFCIDPASRELVLESRFPLQMEEMKGPGFPAWTLFLFSSYTPKEEVFNQRKDPDELLGAENQRVVVKRQGLYYSPFLRYFGQWLPAGSMGN
jgi:hypothetical protein